MIGRPKGSLNKNKQYLWKRLQEILGDDFDPVINMAENAMFLHGAAHEHQAAYRAAVDAGLTEEAKELLAPAVETTERAVASLDKIAKYTNPQLKAVEVSVDPDTPVTGLKLSFEIDPDKVVDADASTG